MSSSLSDFLSNFVKWEVGRSSIREHALSNRRPQDPWKLLMGRKTVVARILLLVKPVVKGKGPGGKGQG